MFSFFQEIMFSRNSGGVRVIFYYLKSILTGINMALNFWKLFSLFANVRNNYVLI